MKRAFYVAAIAIGIALTFSAVLTPAFGGGFEIFFLVLGTICLVGGFLLGIVALILALTRQTTWTKPFLLAAAICLVVGSGMCGSMLLAS